MGEFKKFVFGETLEVAVEAIPEKYQLKFYRMIKNYGLHGIEPELSGFELSTWVQMKVMIDNTIPKRNNGSPVGKRGAPPGNQNAKKTKNNSNQLNNSIDLKTNNCFDETIETNKTNMLNVNDNVNVNDNENVKESQVFALELSELLLVSHRREFPDYLSGKKDKDTIERWAKDIEKLIRLDKKDPENIREVILWVKTSGNFWFVNIESGAKLRNKFERLWAEMNMKKGPSAPANKSPPGLADKKPLSGLVSTF